MGKRYPSEKIVGLKILYFGREIIFDGNAIFGESRW
jgi:hypothetical protein